MKFGGTPPHLGCDCPMDESRLFHGNVSFVPRTSAIYAEVRSGRPGCPGTRPRIVSGRIKSKTGPFFVFFACFIFEKHSLPAERRRFLKNKQSQQQTNTFLKLKTGPIMLYNILGPVLNFNLDQFVTLEFLFFFLFSFVVCFG